MAVEIPYDGWPQSRVSLPGDLTLAVREAPSVEGAEAAVLVHGLGGSSLNWTALMGLLSPRLASRAPDLPGFGFSPPPHDGDYSIEGHARAVIALLEADGRGPVHLFGNSLGGAVSTAVAADRPDLVRTLTLVSPALPDLAPGRWRSQVAVLAAPGVGPAVARRIAALSPQRRVDALVQLCFGDPSAVPLDWREAAERDVLARQRIPYAPDALARSAQGVVRAYLARGPEALWARAARVEAPTLVVFGGRDRLVRSSSAVRVRRTFPDVRVVVFPDAGHVAQMEHPARLARVVVEHLDAHRVH